MVKTFEYKLDGEIYNVEVVFKNNKNTYIKIKEDLTIYVTTNLFTPQREIKKLLDREKPFLRKVLSKVKKRSEKDLEFYYLGSKYDIIKVPFETLEIDNNKIYVKDEKTLEKWLKKEMLKVFEERLQYCFSLFEEKIPFPKLKTRKMKTRWGVCNRKLFGKQLKNTCLIIKRPLKY